MPRVKKQATEKKAPSKKATEVVKVQKSRTVAKTSSASLSIPAYSLAGRATGTLALPKEIFASKVNKSLLAQAIRVYSTNQKSLLSKTKTRGEVEGSTVKIYRQKGTGRARHGAIRAPIFVGGGIVFGPQPRRVRLDLPKRMRKAALISALSSKLIDKSLVGVNGVEKATGKTREIVELLTKITGKKELKSALIITGGKVDSVVRAARNIPGVDVLSANLLNAYEVLKHEILLITKDAVDVLTKPNSKEQKWKF